MELKSIKNNDSTKIANECFCEDNGLITAVIHGQLDGSASDEINDRIMQKVEELTRKGIRPLFLADIRDMTNMSASGRKAVYRAVVDTRNGKYPKIYRSAYAGKGYAALGASVNLITRLFEQDRYRYFSDIKKAKAWVIAAQGPITKR